MGKKYKPDNKGFVFSTNPDFRFEKEEEPVQKTIKPAQQKLKISLDTKHRAGKAVTLITGFIATGSDLEDFGKKIKNFCGTGGSVKNGEIIIQGDQRDKVMQWLTQNGFRASRKN